MFFRHKERQLVCSVHGDDFTVSGPCSSLDWFEEQMKSKYELTVGGRLGTGPKDAKEISMLNRIVLWTPRALNTTMILVRPRSSCGRSTSKVRMAL